MSVKPRSALKIVLGVLAAVFVLCAFAIGWMRFSPRQVPAGQAPLSTMNDGSLPALREAFNASEGEVRILAMLSPT